MKIITFSYDDGVTQDRRLVEILNKYGLKATFNINSGLLGTERRLKVYGVEVDHNKIDPSEVKSLYAGHEVAVHTVHHPHLTALTDDEIVEEVERDRAALSELVGYEVKGMAYPGGGFQNSDRVERVLRERTGVEYSRTISLSYSFEPTANRFRYKPTAFHMDYKVNRQLADEFFDSDSDGIFYIWGHSYEFDANDSWDEFEDFCKYISNREGILYLTNKEAFLAYDNR